MAFEFKFPDVGEGITEGEIVRWLINEGDVVILDQALCEMQTDKAVVEIPAPRAGTILRRVGREGDVIPVGQTLVVIGEPGEGGLKPAQESEPAPASPRPAPPGDGVHPNGPSERGEPTVVPPARIQAAPATRRLARELGIDLARVAGSGPRGRIVPNDVRRAAASQDTAPVTRVPAAPPGERTPYRLQGLRRVIAEHMVQSVREIPHVSVVDRVNARRLVAVRTLLKPAAEARGTRLTYLPLVAKALSLCLPEHPVFNARWDEGTLYLHRSVDIGIATDTDDGLIVPVVRGVDQKSVLEVAAEMGRVTERARARTLAPGELSGSTITITGGGPLAGLFATPIINYPEVAILGVYRIQEEVIVEDGEMRPAPMLYLSLTFDHRVADGAEASRFLSSLKDLLATPELWLLDLR
jgi:pyruvate dehydrogenase E2 component (dihydrolipoamide acetyltransferase)